MSYNGYTFAYVLDLNLISLQFIKDVIIHRNMTRLDFKEGLSSVCCLGRKTCQNFIEEKFTNKKRNFF